jgi:hypothetical protein
MNTVEKRDYIHNYLYRVDDKNIDEMFKKVQLLVEKDITLTLAQENELEKRALRHQAGESKSYSWTEVKKKVSKQK